MVFSWFCSHLLFAIDRSSKKKLEGQIASCPYRTSALGRVRSSVFGYNRPQLAIHKHPSNLARPDALDRCALHRVLKLTYGLISFSINLEADFATSNFHRFHISVMTTTTTEDTSQSLLCSNCFTDEGLKIDAMKLGLEQDSQCPNCRSSIGRKLTKELIEKMAWRFFVRGTTIRTEYGAAPMVQFNEQHHGESDISPSPWLVTDVKLIEEAARIGFFPYNPRLWMLGEVEPLKCLQDSAQRPQIISRILKEYPERALATDSHFYRIRVCPQNPDEPGEYDSPPIAFAGQGRLDSLNFPVMYGSQDLDVCIHECRAAIDDDIYVAKLKPERPLHLLDLTHVLQEDVTEFESLDMAVHMLFLARSHSYEISREIAIAAKKAGFDGLIYPSYFSLIRTGGYPFETVYGMSMRRYHPQAQEYAQAYTIENLALFGRPLEDCNRPGKTG